MTKYKILYIDEEESEIENFSFYVANHKLNEYFQLENSMPYANIDDMLDYIIKSGVDALVVDFRLNEKKTNIEYNVPYNGEELIVALQKIKNAFPCFLRTNHVQEGAEYSHDANIVYAKFTCEELNTLDITFLEKIKFKIEKYIKIKKENEKKFKELLIKKRSGNLSIFEEEHFKELNSFLEKSIDARNVIPKTAIESSNEKKLQELISKTDELIKKLEQMLDA